MAWVCVTSGLCLHPADLPFPSDGSWEGEQALGREWGSSGVPSCIMQTLQLITMNTTKSTTMF